MRVTRKYWGQEYVEQIEEEEEEEEEQEEGEIFKRTVDGIIVRLSPGYIICRFGVPDVYF